jgi:hypothetical protein
MNAPAVAGKAMNMRRVQDLCRKLSREANQSPTEGKNRRRKSGGRRSDGTLMGSHAVYQRQRLLINKRGRSSESRTGENLPYGLTRGLRERQSWGTGNPSPIPKGGVSETLHLTPPAPRFYFTRRKEKTDRGNVT